MSGWILFAHELDPALPEVPEILRLQETALNRGMALQVMQPAKFDLVVGDRSEWAVRYAGKAIDRPDFVLCRTGAETDYPTLALLRHLERRGVRLVNSSAAIELVADKLHTLQSLSRAGLPIPRSVLGKLPMDVEAIANDLGFPVIVKTLKGTRGTGVLKCEDRQQFEDLAGLLESAKAQADFLLQSYIRASHGRDVRVLVIGGRVAAAMERRSLTGSFKSNVSMGGVGEAYNPPQEMAELAVRAAETLGLDVTGIDILFDESGYRICEANSAPGFQGLERATGCDVAAAILDWIAATQNRAPEAAESPEGDLMVDLIFGGRSGLRALSDRDAGYSGFAAAVGVRLVLAGLSAIGYAVMPKSVVDPSSRFNSTLGDLFARRQGRVAGFDVAEQERTLIAILIVSFWAAVIPWLAGAELVISAALSILALLFPLLFLLTAPSRLRRTGTQFPGTAGG